MKIEKISLKKHFFFGDCEIIFQNSEGKPLDTIVVGGINGSGKTTLLEAILDILTGSKNNLEQSFIDLAFHSLMDRELIKPRFKIPEDISERKFNASKITRRAGLQQKLKEIPSKERPKIIFLPAEISFENLKAKETAFDYSYSFKNVIDKRHVSDIPTFISSMIKDAVFKNKELPAQTSIQKVCEEINRIFQDLEIDVKLTGLAENGEKLPTFCNSSGKEFNINGLSSGEKQLFVRALTLKMVEANNSIILVDEPEISLHPKWQQKIVKVYERIGKNNQVIIATHSPHILSSVAKESAFLLSREGSQVKVLNHEQLNSIYGKPVNIVLTDFMGLESDRDPAVEKLFNEVREMLRQKKTNTSQFKGKMDSLIEIVGEIDQDIILLKMELARLESKGSGKNA
jgi:predicted ATP-binding protein involved in virulence